MRNILFYGPNPKLSEKVAAVMDQKLYQVHFCDAGTVTPSSFETEQAPLVMIDTQLKWSESHPILDMASRFACPVLFLTRDISMEEHLRALYGYPCEVARLPASASRIRKLLIQMDHTQVKKESTELLMNQKEKTAMLDGRTIPLTAQEYALLSALMESPDAPVSRESLLRKAWGYQSMGETRTVDVHVQRLRKKLGTQLIETVYKCGYRLNLA